jgi:hypothetical protein
MIICEKEVNGKTFKMELEFDGKYTRLVNNVLECLDDKTIAVPNPNIKWSPPWKDSESIEDEELFINRLQTWPKPKDYPLEKLTPVALGLIEIPVLEWLPVTCQHVAFDTAFATYLTPSVHPIPYAFDMKMSMGNMHRHRDNLQEYIMSRTPFSGNSANEIYSGGIITLNRELKQTEDAFRFVLAHELIHAIDKLEIVYPALTDWNGFCFNVLELDSNGIEDLKDTLITERMIDSKDYELDILEGYFGNIIYIWHGGYEELRKNLQV